MLIERLTGSFRKTMLPPRLAQALDYLRATDMMAVSIGRCDLDGDRLFALVQEYTTRAADRCVWEAHRRYIDVQLVVFGVERIGYANIAHAREREPYDPARDVAFFEPGFDYITLQPGMLAILGPEDVHSPGAAAGEPERVRKVVIKAAVD